MGDGLRAVGVEHVEVLVLGVRTEGIKGLRFRGKFESLGVSGLGFWVEGLILKWPVSSRMHLRRWTSTPTGCSTARRFSKRCERESERDRKTEGEIRK